MLMVSTVHAPQDSSALSGHRCQSLVTKRKEKFVLPAQVFLRGRKQAQAFVNRGTSTPSANATSVLLGSFARTTQTRSTLYT